MHGLTFAISGDSFAQYDRSGNEMNSAIAEYIEGIEVIKAFGRAGVSYEKYAGAITGFRTFVVRWLTSTFVTMKLSFAPFPSPLIGTLPTALALAGSGKTTICSLLARFYDPQGGSITLGGHDLREFTCDSLLANISMVFQNVYLFHDTIRANICFGKPDASEAEMIAAAKKARCHDFIIALPNGYDTVVGEGGESLSGGEKQRISIAQAILKDAPSSSWTRPPPAWTRKTST